MKNPAISAVIITRNRPEELRHCIDHILNQRVGVEEVIVIDSSDNELSREVVAARNSADAIPIRHVSSEAGTGHQRLRGVEESLGDVVLYVDDDVYLDPGFTKAVLEVFASKVWDRIGGVTGNNTEGKRPGFFNIRNRMRRFYFLPCFGRGQFQLSGFHTTANGLSGVRRIQYMGGAFTAYRRSVLEEIPPDGENFSFFCEDMDLSYRVAQKYVNYYASDAKCIHVASKTNRKPAATFNQDLLAAYDVFWEKNISPTATHRLARRLARFALKQGFYHFTARDYVHYAFRHVLGERMFGWTRSFYQRCFRPARS